MSESGWVMMRLVQPLPRPVGAAGGHVRAEEQVVGVGRGCRAAVAGPGGPAGTGRRVHRGGGMHPAVLEDTDVYPNRRLGEHHLDTVRAGAGRLDVCGVVDGLGQRSWIARRADRARVDVSRGVGHRGDRGAGVIPSDHDHVQVPGRLRRDVLDAQGRDVGLRRGVRELDELNAPPSAWVIRPSPVLLVLRVSPSCGGAL